MTIKNYTKNITFSETDNQKKAMGEITKVKKIKNGYFVKAKIDREGILILNSKVFKVKSKSKSSIIAPTWARSTLAFGKRILPDWLKNVALGRGRSLILNFVLVDML